MNHFRIKRGQNPPINGLLENYELGFCKENQSLYIGVPNSFDKNQAILIGGAITPDNSDSYVGRILGYCLLKAGGTMTGNLDMSNHIIQNVGLPTADFDVANKKYVDKQLLNKLSLSGGVMTGPLNMSNNKIINIPEPVLEHEVANKKYIDKRTNDFIIAHGSTNGWTWRKWESGIAECWIRQTYNDIYIHTWWEYGYTSDKSYGIIPYPFPFKETPSEIVNGRILGTFSVNLYTSEANSINSSGSYYYFRPTADTIYRDGVLDMYVVGKWK